MFFKNNYKKNIINFLFICYLIYLLSIFINYIKNNKEGFIPSINVLYRPHIRKARIFTDKLLEDIKKKKDNFLNKLMKY